MEPSEASYSVNVGMSDGLPPTEIYLLGDAMPNESALTPAHANLSMKDKDASDESPELVHPHAPKNKRQAAPKKFTFEELSHESTLSESRDEDDPAKPDEKDEVNQVERDDEIKANGEIKADGEIKPHVKPDATLKTQEDVEREEGAYWFTECSVPQAPFDEEPDTPSELTLFCNGLTPTLTPKAPTVPALPATIPVDQLDTIQESDNEMEDKIEDKSLDVKEDTDLPQTAALESPASPVFANVAIPTYAQDLNMAPSDELENRGSTEELPTMDVVYPPVHATDDITHSVGDLREQFDHMRVSDALVAAVTQTFQQDHNFLGAEQLCGHDLMNWFNGPSE